MVINITGGNKKIRSLTKSLVEYCADKLKLNDTILLDIKFSRTLYKEDGILGEVDFIHHLIIIPIYPTIR